MGNDNKDDEAIKRRGEEAELEKNLADSDVQAGREKPIKADISSSDREEQRRGKFVDVHADEDRNPDSSERDVYGDETNSQPKVAAKGRGKLMRTLKKMLNK